MKMYFFVFHVQPRSDLENVNNIGEAYVSCWIEANSIIKAEKISMRKISDLKWDILEKEEAFEIASDHYAPDSDGFEFYQQALIDKCVLRFHTYPAEE